MEAEEDTTTKNESEREAAILNNTSFVFYKIYKILK